MQRVNKEYAELDTAWIQGEIASGRDSLVEAGWIDDREYQVNTHKIKYQILNTHQKSRTKNFRDVEAHATPEELKQLDLSGYLLKERMFQSEHLDQLREAVDKLFEAEVDLEKRETRERSWGPILRYLEDKDPVFLELIRYQPILSIAKAMMGPILRLRGLSSRISFPGEEIQSAPYHQHLRVNQIPRPPWFSDPHSLDALIYLDDLNEDAGLVYLVPGSHAWQDREPPYRQYDPLDDEVSFAIPAGSVVLMHGNLWHRTGPTVGTRRRMLILSYTPSWLCRSTHGTKPEDGLTDAALKNADQELRELLGVEGKT